MSSQEVHLSKWNVGWIVCLDTMRDIPMVVAAVLFDGSGTPQYKLQWANNGALCETWATEMRIVEYRE